MISISSPNRSKMLRRFFFIVGVRRSFSSVNSSLTSRNRLICSYDSNSSLTRSTSHLDPLADPVVATDPRGVLGGYRSAGVGPRRQLLEVRDDQRGDELPAVAEHDALFDELVGGKPVFDRTGRDVLPGREHEQLGALAERDVPVRSELDDVAGAEPGSSGSRRAPRAGRPPRPRPPEPVRSR